jgi:integrase
MAVKIGIRDVLAMQPHTILWDTEARGFHARRQFRDAVTFGVFYRNQEGLQRWLKIGRFGTWTVADARKQAQRILRARDLGEDPSAAKMALRDAMTMEQLCDEYIQNGMNDKKASTIRGDLSRIKVHIKPALGKRKVTGVTSDDVEQFMRSINQGGARRVTWLLSAMFTYAIKRKLRADNPVHGIDIPADAKRTRRLSESEYVQLWSALENEQSVASEVFLFLVETGWRSGEARTLQFSEIDLGVCLLNLAAVGF